ncbi:MAG TPA: rod shape-determining protein MreC [Verrucomicrobiae bacterium]|jgi:rod shape-determining protein MreC|nr:rod shape-determining protein MreC [Verrucomicrobiae bacterium]
MQIKRRYYFLAFSFLPLILFSRIPGLTQDVQMTSQSLLRPFLSVGSSVSNNVSGFFNYFFLFWKTIEELEQDRAQIAQLESHLEQYKEVERENERLRKLLEFRDQFKGKTIAARVIGWDLSPWKKTIILDKGSKQGLRKDMPVIVSEGLVGRILEAGRSTAQVILLVDPEARVSALAADSRSQGLASGNGSQTLTLDYLSLDSQAAVEETVLTSGATGLFPKGLRIGKITAIEKSKDGLHLSATVQPFAAFTKIEEVLCIVSSQAG